MSAPFGSHKSGFQTTKGNRLNALPSSWFNGIAPTSHLHSAFQQPVMDLSVPVQSGYRYSDANYPDIPTYVETGTDQRFFDSAATGANDGSDWANAFTNETTALQTNLCDSASVRILTCRGTFTIPSGGIDCNARANSDGTAGNEIIFRADPVNGCTIDGALGTIYMGGWNRWLVYGFTTVDGSAIFAQTGSGKSTQPSNYVMFRDMDMTMSTGGDNTGALKLDAGSGIELNYIGVMNCKIFGPGLAVHGNTACIYIKAMGAFRIMNNEVTNAPKPIYHKHHRDAQYTAYTGYIEYNSIGWNGVGNSRLASKEIYFRHNLLWGKQVQFTDNGGGDNGADSNIITNITGYLQFAKGNSYPDTNIVKDCVQRKLNTNQYVSDTQDDSSDIDYNLYNAGAGNAVLHRGTHYDLAGWQAVNRSVAGFPDANSVEKNASFVGGASPSTILGWALNFDVDWNTMSSVGGKPGADMTRVGTGR